MAVAELQYIADWMIPRRAQYMRYQKWVWLPLSVHGKCFRQPLPTFSSLVAMEVVYFTIPSADSDNSFVNKMIFCVRVFPGIQVCQIVPALLADVHISCHLSHNKFRMYPSRWIVFLTPEHNQVFNMMRWIIQNDFDLSNNVWLISCSTTMVATMRTIYSTVLSCKFNSAFWINLYKTFFSICYSWRCMNHAIF